MDLSSRTVSYLRDEVKMMYWTRFCSSPPFKRIFFLEVRFRVGVGGRGFLPYLATSGHHEARSCLQGLKTTFQLIIPPPGYTVRSSSVVLGCRTAEWAAHNNNPTTGVRGSERSVKSIKAALQPGLTNHS